MCPGRSRARGGVGGGEGGGQRGGGGWPALCASALGVWSLGLSRGAWGLGAWGARPHGPWEGGSFVPLPPLHGQQRGLPLCCTGHGWCRLHTAPVLVCLLPPWRRPKGASWGGPLPCWLTDRAPDWLAKQASLGPLHPSGGRGRPPASTPLLPSPGSSLFVGARGPLFAPGLSLVRGRARHGTWRSWEKREG